MKINFIYISLLINLYSCSANIITRTWHHHIRPTFYSIIEKNYTIDSKTHPEIQPSPGTFNIDLIPKNAIYTTTLYADDALKLVDFLKSRSAYPANILEQGGTHVSTSTNITYTTTPTSSPQLQFLGSNFCKSHSLNFDCSGQNVILRQYNIYPLPNPSQKTTYRIDCSSVTGKANNNFLEITIEARPRILPPEPITPQTDNPHDPIMENNIVTLSKIAHVYRLTLKPGQVFSFTIPHNESSGVCEGNKTFSFGVQKPDNSPALVIGETPSSSLRTYHVTTSSTITEKTSYSIYLKLDALFQDNHGCMPENQRTLGRLEIVVAP